MRRGVVTCVLTLLASTGLTPSFAQFAPGARTLVLSALLTTTWEQEATRRSFGYSARDHRQR